MTGQDIDESDFSGSPTIFFVRLIYNNYVLQLGETHQYGEKALRIMAHYNGGKILALINQTAKRSDAATVRLQKLYCSKSALLALEPTIAKLDLLGDCQNKLMMHGSDVDCQVKNGGATRYFHILF